MSREGTRTEVTVRSFSATDMGLTLVQSILPGIHAGATLKYVRGTLRGTAGDSSKAASDLLHDGEELSGGHAENRFDLDAGLMGVAGALRVGAVMRNVRAPTFGDGAFALPRQTRVGAAIDVEKAGGPPLLFAVDADVRRYATTSGQRRVIAVGAESWMLARRLGVRVGGRLNRVGARERVATAGASVAVRNGVYVEGQVVHGGAAAERGWGAGARVTF